MMKNAWKLDGKTLRFALPWTMITLVSALCLRALRWGAAPGSLGQHLRYGLSYSLHSGKLSLGLMCLGCFLLALVEGEALRREQRQVYIPALLLAALFSLNTLIYQSPTGTLENLWRMPFCDSTEALLHWFAQVGSWYGLSLAFFHWLGRRLPQRPPVTVTGRHCALWAFTMALLWLPVLIFRFPGSIYADTDMQVLQFLGQFPWEASNPIALSFVYGPLFWLGRHLGSDNLGIFLCVLGQLALNLFACAFACREVARERRSLGFGWLLALFFGLVPTYPAFVAAALKDFIHAPLYLLFGIYLRRCTRGGDRRELWKLLLLAVLCGATRKGAVYLVLLCLLALGIHRRDARRLLLTAVCGILAGHLCLNSLIFPAIGVEKPMEKENYSFFYPITGYYCQRYDGELTQQEKQIIADVLDYETVKIGFSTGSVDRIKSTFHAQNGEQVAAYLRLHGSFFLRHPLTCLEALVYSRNLYFTPWSNQGERITTAQHPFSEVTPDAHSDFSYLLPESVRQCFENFQWALLDRPLVRVLTSCGSYVWLSLLLFGAALWQGDREKTLWLVSLLAMVLGLLLTHLNGAVRYASPLLYLAPVFLLLYRVKSP